LLTAVRRPRFTSDGGRHLDAHRCPAHRAGHGCDRGFRRPCSATKVSTH